ncbi:MAG: PE-PPE domain-containing protein, partial [Comamonadaceae bacterium]
MLSVLVCRGIGEPLPSPMLANVTRLLDRKRFVVKEIPWRAQYGPVPAALGSSYDKSLDTGRTMLLKAIAADPNPVILLGYSGGAALAGNVAAEIAQGKHPELEVRGAALLSDPLSPRVINRDGWGIAGSRWIGGGFPVWHMSDPADVIARCPANSPLRTLADQSAAFSLADPVAWGAD